MRSNTNGYYFSSNLFSDLVVTDAFTERFRPMKFTLLPLFEWIEGEIEGGRWIEVSYLRLWAFLYGIQQVGRGLKCGTSYVRAEQNVGRFYYL